MARMPPARRFGALATTGGLLGRRTELAAIDVALEQRAGMRREDRAGARADIAEACGRYRQVQPELQALAASGSLGPSGSGRCGSALPLQLLKAS